MCDMYHYIIRIHWATFTLGFHLFTIRIDSAPHATRVQVFDVDKERMGNTHETCSHAR